MSPEKKDAAHEVDLIAPWKAVERLDDADARALDRLLAEDPSLGKRLDAADEERDAAVELNEALPTPSNKARDRLFSRIEGLEAGRAPMAEGILSRFAGFLTALSPQTLAWGAGAAALLIAVQAGLLAGAYVGGGEGSYQTASDGSHVSADGPTALIAFQPTATAADIAKALRGAKAEIVGGPKPGGVFVIRIGFEPLDHNKLEAALKPLRDNAAVKMVTPGG